MSLDGDQTLTVLLTPHDASLQTTIRVLDDDGTVLGESSAGGPGELHVMQTATIATDGTYAIEVVENQGQGAYEF